MNTAEYAHKAIEAETVDSLKKEVKTLTDRLMTMKPNLRQSKVMRKIMAEYQVESVYEVERLQLKLMVKAIKRQINVLDIIV